MNLNADTDLLRDFMPSHLLQEGNFIFDTSEILNDNAETTKDVKKVTKNSSEKSESQVSWLSLFKELDPLANQDALSSSGDRA